MVIHPLEDRIIVELDAPATTTRSGLFLPESAAERPQEGVVTAVGPGKSDGSGGLVPFFVNVGDRVLVGKFAGTELKIGTIRQTIMRASDVLAVLKAEEPA